MKLLIIGDNLKEVNGVPNYTRPLFSYLLNQGIDVEYLYTSSQQRNYSFFYKTGIQRVKDRVYEYKNCPVLVNNYNQPLQDAENDSVNHEIASFIKERQYSVVHIHSMLGLPASIYGVIKACGVKLFTTVHEYWWLCPYRVMVDYNNCICDGPFDFHKCAFCTDQKPQLRTNSKRILQMKLEHDAPWFMNLLKKIKRLKSSSSSYNSEPQEINAKEILFQRSLDYPKEHNKAKAEEFRIRLREAINGLNICDKVICVSSDVKRILSTYGVKEEKLLVQHIGSVIAEKQVKHTKPVDPQNITFGFIGGVGYYKGVHHLVQAYVQMPEEYKKRSNLKIYGGYSDTYYKAIRQEWIDDSDSKRIQFFGRFQISEVPDISNTIDISVLPSLCADTAPQTIFESFSTGLPIIAPRIGGFPDFVVDGVNGLIFEAASPSSLQEKMEQIVCNPELIEEFQKHIPRNKTIPENIKELLSLYC